ncbi:hypothetical protein [Halomarina oriensis]|uniref:Uncharacterized protein n=1 Tax=Halomarina oriensis TaxID=671145 RepID=A0A6B0GMQ6_9EURY|nr:hypothetical protein [Halomarina oriensis]MWG35211.1 hypothetical protein [Halomarina oriensis]
MAPDRLRPPEVPERLLSEGGWSLLDAREETLATLPAARVEGVTHVYEDDELRERVAGATGVDRTWRFVFATRVVFSPPLAPGIGTAMVRPMVASEARTAFADDLDRRGFVDVRQGRSERVRSETGERVRLRSYRGRLPVDDETLGIEGWLGVWSVDGEFRIAGGAYPVALDGFVDAADVPDRRACRDELLRFVRSVN